MNKQKRYKVDRNRVATELAKRDIHSYTQLAEMCGYSAGWAANQLNGDIGINGPLLKALEGLGISYESIKQTEEIGKPVAKAPGPKVLSDLTENELYSVIFKAVRDALASE